MRAAIPHVTHHVEGARAQAARPAGHASQHVGAVAKLHDPLERRVDGLPGADRLPVEQLQQHGVGHGSVVVTGRVGHAGCVGSAGPAGTARGNGHAEPALRPRPGKGRPGRVAGWVVRPQGRYDACDLAEAIDPPLGIFELLSTGAGDVLLGVVDEPADLVHVFLEHEVEAAFPQVRIAPTATALAPGVTSRAVALAGMVVVAAAAGLGQVLVIRKGRTSARHAHVGAQLAGARADQVLEGGRLAVDVAHEVLGAPGQRAQGVVEDGAVRSGDRHCETSQASGARTVIVPGGRHSARRDAIETNYSPSRGGGAGGAATYRRRDARRPVGVIFAPAPRGFRRRNAQRRPPHRVLRARMMSWGLSMTSHEKR